MKKLLVLLLALCMLFTQFAVAQADEVTPDLDWLKGSQITIVVPFKAGGSLDLMVRAFVPYWEAASGASFIVDNRPGANSQVGTELFFTMTQDASIIYCGTQTYVSGNILNGANYQIEDFHLINMQQMDPTTLTVLTDSPYKTIDELVEAIKANPGKIKCGMTAGGAGAIMLYMLKQAYNLDVKIVTYDSGNDFRTALLGGHVDFICGSANGDLGLGDKALPLVVCGTERNVLWPDCPATEEVWPELGIPASLGSCRYFSTSSKAAADYPERFAALRATYEEAFNNADYQQLLVDNGQYAVSGLYTPDESDALNITLNTLIFDNAKAFEED